jgi:hypothetical protein
MRAGNRATVNILPFKWIQIKVIGFEISPLIEKKQFYCVHARTFDFQGE